MTNLGRTPTHGENPPKLERSSEFHALPERNTEYPLQIERNSKSQPQLERTPSPLLQFQRWHQKISRGARSPLPQLKKTAHSISDKTSAQLERSTVPAQERSTGTHRYKRASPTIRDMQLTIIRQVPIHHIWRRAPPHIETTVENLCLMQLEKRPPPQLET